MADIYSPELTYSQSYYRANKEKLLAYVKEKTRCDCGALVARINMAKHRRTMKHRNRMKHRKYLEDEKLEHKYSFFKGPEK